MSNLTISLDTIANLTDEKLFQLCIQHPEIRFERNAQGDLAIMAPKGSDTGMRNLELGGYLWNWNQQKKLGVALAPPQGLSYRMEQCDRPMYHG